MDEDRRGRFELPVLNGPGSVAAPVGGPGTAGERRPGAVPTTARDPAADGGPGAPDAAVRVGLVTLGCDKNTVDSERIMARLIGAGAEVSDDVEDAHVVVVNTCGFIDRAKEESIDTILEAARLKEEGRIQAVVAMGCLVQRYEDELREELPEVDLFLRLTEMGRLVPVLRERGLLPQPGDFVPNMERPLRILTGGARHTSHLKISEGCDHSCAFCAIPLMRGKFRSTPIEQLVREARELEAQGVVELNVVSQDTTWYGRDWARGRAVADGEFFVGAPFDGMAGIAAGRGAPSGAGGGAGHDPSPSPSPGRGRGKRGAREQPDPNHRYGYLPDLLQALAAETTIPWIRLFYMYPSGIYPELVELIAREPRIVPYLDMPIQHGADPVLERMRRPERRSTIRERVAWLRHAIPDLTLRSTVIVGFPGETDDDFEAMLELLEEIRFDHLGAFAYSKEEATRAAAMPDQVPDAVKRERLERLMDVQRAISLEKNEGRIGRETRVLVDRRTMADEEGDVVGRTPAQAPEIDGVVYVDGAAGVEPGEFVNVRITGTTGEWDLVAAV